MNKISSLILRAQALASHILPAKQLRSSSSIMSQEQAKTSQIYDILQHTTVSIPDHLQPFSLEEIYSFPAFKTWLMTLNQSLKQQSRSSHPFHEHPYSLRKIEVQSVDRFSGKRLGFIKLKADVRNDKDEHFPGSVFMRGGSVAMLLVLHATSSKSTDADVSVDSNGHRDSRGSEPPKKRARRAVEAGEEYAILTTQPRIPAGSLTFTEIPAGMLDDSGSFSGAAAREIAEETGLVIKEDELIDLTKLASEAQENDSDEEDVEQARENLQNAIYPSPGGSDEFIPIFYCRKEMDVTEIEGLRGRLTGLRDRGEKITLKIVKLRDLWKVAGRDGKSLAAVTLLDGLKREGKIT